MLVKPFHQISFTVVTLIIGFTTVGINLNFVSSAAPQGRCPPGQTDTTMNFKGKCVPVRAHVHCEPTETRGANGWCRRADSDASSSD